MEERKSEENLIWISAHKPDQHIEHYCSCSKQENRNPQESKPAFKNHSDSMWPFMAIRFNHEMTIKGQSWKRDIEMAAVKSICNQLREERERQGISQQKLSELAGISRTGLRHIESLETSPTLYSVLKLAKALDIDPSDLLAS